MKCVTRRAKLRGVAAACVLVAAVVLLVYHHTKQTDTAGAPENVSVDVVEKQRAGLASNLQGSSPISGRPFSWSWMGGQSTVRGGECRPMSRRKDVDIRTPDVYATLNFNSYSKSYWNQTFERRYYEARKNWDKLPLKVSPRICYSVRDFVSSMMHSFLAR